MLNIDVIVFGHSEKAATKSTIRQFERLNVPYHFVCLKVASPDTITHLEGLEIGFHDNSDVAIEVTGNVRIPQQLPQKAWTGFRPSRNRIVAELIDATTA